MLKLLLLVFCLSGCKNRSGAHMIIWFQNRVILLPPPLPPSNTWFHYICHLNESSCMIGYLNNSLEQGWVIPNSFTWFHSRTGLNHSPNIFMSVPSLPSSSLPLIKFIVLIVRSGANSIIWFHNSFIQSLSIKSGSFLQSLIHFYNICHQDVSSLIVKNLSVLLI